MKISYLPYKEIDKTKWDKCVAGASNRLIYGFSWYLSKMALNWDGLVLGDYESVMPLTWRKKIGIKYLYQPAFMQQAGIFSQTAITSEMTGAFLKEAAKHFRFAEISLNYANATIQSESITQGRRVNYILPLDSYKKVCNNYEPAFTKSLRRIKKFNIKYGKSDDYTSVVELYKELYGTRLPSFQQGDYTNIIAICRELKNENNLVTRFALTPDNKLLAGVVLLKDADRLYNLISCINEEGKKLEANYFLYDKVVEEFSGCGLLLDLEGSEVPGIAAFYKKLNPLLQPYPWVKYNELHPILRLLKK